MPEHVRALMVVLVLGGSVFLLARRAFVDLIPAATYTRWRNLWLLMTLALFLAHSYWVYALLVAVYAVVATRRESHLLGLYFLLLFVAPPSRVEVPGLGLVNHLFVLDQYRLLALALLLPAALALLQRSSSLKLGRSPVDWMVLGFFALTSLLHFREANLTSGLRNIVTNGIDVFLPYYVVSRSIRDMDGFKAALSGFMIGAMVLSVVALFEVLRSWKLYSAVLGALGLNPSEFGGYLRRAGFLRPTATVGNSIVLGYVVMVGLGFALFLKEFVASTRLKWLGMGVLVLGVIASLSRGPWVGAVFMLLVYVAMGPRAIKQLMRIGVVALGVGLLLGMFPFGQMLIEMLPFVGTVDEGNVEYRANLLTQALPVIQRNLWLGSVDYLETPELQVMLQGEGIVDLVNSYILVALDVGLVGLALFAGVFVLALREVKRSMRRAHRHSAEAEVLGRALFAVLASIMLVIYTVSSITAVPVVYWSVAGLCVAYAQFVSEAPRASEESR